MDDLSTLATSRGRGLRIFKGLIADDATESNDTVNVRIPAYDASRQFGPCHWAPRMLNDRTPLWPNRNDECLVALDEHDQAEILNWWADDPTSEPVEYPPERKDFGVAGTGALTAFNTPVEPLHSDGTPRRLTVTPPWDAWLEVVYRTIVTVQTGQPAGWSRMDALISVSPSPPVLSGQQNFGANWGRACSHGHSGVPWDTIEARATIPLSANVAYTFTPRLIISEGADVDWWYYRGEFAYIEHGGLRRRI